MRLELLHLPERIELEAMLRKYTHRRTVIARLGNVLGGFLMHAGETYLPNANIRRASELFSEGERELALVNWADHVIFIVQDRADSDSQFMLICYYAHLLGRPIFSNDLDAVERLGSDIPGIDGKSLFIDASIDQELEA